AWGLQASSDSINDLVRETVAQVLREAPGVPRSPDELPEDEQVLLEIWESAATFALDADLKRAGGKKAWAAALMSGLGELRRRRTQEEKGVFARLLVSHSNNKINSNTYDNNNDNNNNLPAPGRAAGGSVLKAPKRLVDVADSMLEKLGDPYAQYYPPEEWSEKSQVASSEGVSGLGIAFAQDTTRGRGGSPQVVAVVSGSSAAAAGVRVGDRLLEVDGESVRVPADAARLIPGRPGTRARVRLEHQDKARLTESSARTQGYTVDIERSMLLRLGCSASRLNGATSTCTKFVMSSFEKSSHSWTQRGRRTRTNVVVGTAGSNSWLMGRRRPTCSLAIISAAASVTLPRPSRHLQVT
ncbi:unnamed protein product, partial [Polarella glacialis]